MRLIQSSHLSKDTMSCHRMNINTKNSYIWTYKFCEKINSGDDSQEKNWRPRLIHLWVNLWKCCKIIRHFFLLFSDQLSPQGGGGSSYTAKPEMSSNGIEYQVTNGRDHYPANTNGTDPFTSNANGIDHSSNGASNGNVSVQQHRYYHRFERIIFPLQ